MKHEDHFCLFYVLFRMATVSKDGTWKIWDIGGKRHQIGALLGTFCVVRIFLMIGLVP